jgi:hypothetical protein
MRHALTAALLLVASFAVPYAQQPTQPPAQPPQQTPPAPQTPPAGRGRGAGGGAPAAPAKPLVPVAASTVVNNPDQYVGEMVSLTATVESTLTKSAW